MEIHCLNPQVRDHPNKVLASIDLKRSTSLSISSKIWVLRFHQINHIRQAGTIFQTFEELFPKTFLHAKKRETIVYGITH